MVEVRRCGQGIEIRHQQRGGDVQGTADLPAAVGGDHGIRGLNRDGQTVKAARADNEAGHGRLPPFGCKRGKWVVIGFGEVRAAPPYSVYGKQTR